MVTQEFLEWSAGQQLERLLELVHAEEEQSETGRQAPNVDFRIQAMDDT